jgi:hypothetical protein
MIDEALKVYDVILDEWDVPSEHKALARRHRAAWERAADPPRRPAVDGALAAARHVKRAVERRVLWYAEAPPEVAAALAAIAATARS